MDLEELKAALEGYHATASENQTSLKALLAKYADTEKRIDGMERKLNIGRLRGGSPGEESGDAAEFHKALGGYVRTGDETELKAMSVGTDPDGGYFVHPTLSVTMTKKLWDDVPMRRLARIQPIGSDAFEEPLDREQAGAEWVGEKEARPATDTPQVGVLRIPAHEIYANLTVTQKLLDDAGIDMGAWTEEKIADRFSRLEGTGFVTGNGIKKPRGFMSYDAPVTTDDATRTWGVLQYVASGAATAVTADSIRDVYWKLRAPYRKNATWVMASSTANAIDKLKDGNGDYIWRSGQTADAPPSLLGRPVEFSEDMAAIGAGALPIAFGDFKRGYTIVDRTGVRYLRDPYTNKPNMLFYAIRRVGGDVNDFDAIKLLKVATS